MGSRASSCVAASGALCICAYPKYRLSVLGAIKLSGMWTGYRCCANSARRADIAVEFGRVGSALLIRGIT